MVKRLIWSKRALQDKKLIFDYWNKTNGNKYYSRKLNNEFKKILALLLTFPELGMKVENHNVRSLIKEDYIVFYMINIIEDFMNIEILHIWDSRRNPEDLEI